METTLTGCKDLEHVTGNTTKGFEDLKNQVISLGQDMKDGSKRTDQEFRRINCWIMLLVGGVSFLIKSATYRATDRYTMLVYP